MSQSNRSGFETLGRSTRCRRCPGLNPTVVVLKREDLPYNIKYAKRLNPTVVVLKRRKNSVVASFNDVSIQP